MRHLEENDIARFADGNVNKAERETFLEHFAQCDLCLKAYTDTLKFAEERKKRRWFQWFPITTNVSVYPYLQSVGFFFKRGMASPTYYCIGSGKSHKEEKVCQKIKVPGVINRKKLAAPALAFLILLLVILSPLIKKITTNETNTAKLKYIEECIMKKENQENYGLFPSKNPINSAIRSGFYTEDLEVVLHSGGKKELKIKITRMLAAELEKIVEGEMDLAFLRLEEISKRSFKKIVLEIRRILETKSLFQLYQFGRFVERSILATFEKKTPKKNELEKYLQVVRKYNLPKSVPDKMEEIKKTSRITGRRELWNDVKEIF
jgi:hypothetical protein